MTYLLGIDKGTSVIKAVVFDALGTECGKALERVAVLRPQPGWHEEDPEATWAACGRVIRGALEQAGVGGDAIHAIGIAGHMGGAWIIDAAGAPVRNGIGWPDSRAQAQLMRLQEAGLLSEIFAIGGNGLMPGVTAVLLGWLAKFEPGILTRAAFVFSAKDYLRFRLTGAVATEPSDISFVPGDIDGRRFSQRIFDLCGAGAWGALLPPVLPSESIAGGVSEQAAQQTGLRPGTPVIHGMGDACANAIGVGAVAAGAAITVLGTSCLNSLVLGHASREPAGVGFLFAMPDQLYMRILPNTSGTIVLDWYLDRFGGPTQADGGRDYAEMERLAASVPPGAGGVILLPYVNESGVLAPVYDTLARGSFFGLSTHTTEAHMLRSVYESLCFATRDCFAGMAERPSCITLTGGGAQSKFWAQMFADVCGIPIEVKAVQESGALGVAILAGVATGVWTTIAQGTSATARAVTRFEPDSETAELYDGWFALYQTLRRIYLSFSERRHALVPAPLTRISA
ncbi:carbohydrate kinase [Acidisoma cellulosilytica]|uniref:Carbohydrate kinase n=1 Tax=Acidisoma cellulosilyticum TaxID=2802395 RepID=A0A963Z4H8_9PROT|nr:FGGY-family carbohydrate kinase [Acidisoma cellulosilyticum]MCB8882598.1 carbohydrate kinase [Acidisoma cellulosilyticum]